MSGTLYTEDALLPLSALQHLVFCERQCALIHLEQVWEDNPLTVEGSHLHGRVDEGPVREVRGSLVIVRGLRLRSLRLGLAGRCDVVELQRCSEPGEPQRGGGGVVLSGLGGSWQPFPVEYKRGKPKRDRCDEVQLCAQAMCLEEMLACTVPAGALFYGRNRRRHPVAFDDELRSATEEAAARLHRLLSLGETPAARQQGKCRRCSLRELCLPGVGKRSARRWLQRRRRSGADQDPGTGDTEADPGLAE